MAVLDSEQAALLEEVLQLVIRRPPAPPLATAFRVQHAHQRARIDDLVSKRMLVRVSEYYVPTIPGLQALGTEPAQELIRRCNELIALLQRKVRAEPNKVIWDADELAADSQFDEDDVKVLLTTVLQTSTQVSDHYALVASSPWVASVHIDLDGVLDAQPFPELLSESSAATGPWTLSRLYVHNFRTFVNFEWKPPRAAVLVGDNGAGKSAFVEVLWLLRALLVRGLAVEETVADGACNAWLQETEQTFEIDALHGDEKFTYRLGIHHGDPVSVHEELRGPTGLLYRASAGVVELFGDIPGPTPRTTIGFDRRRSFIAAIEPQRDNRRIVAFREFISSIQAIKPDANRLIGAAGDESRELRYDLSNFPGWYLARVAEDPDAFALLMGDLKQALKGFGVLRFQPISPRVKALQVRFAFRQASYELEWSQLSDGQRLLIALYAWLRFGLPSASLIVVDEAENFVSPTEIQPWLIAVADAVAERGQQLLFISHHPESINYLAADAAWQMWRDPASGHTRIGLLEPDLDAGVTAYDAFKDEVMARAEASDT